MCGIAGIISEREEQLGLPLRRMLETMRHRGPDGAGFVIGSELQRGQKLEALEFEGRKGRAAFGHIRLAITGESSALQPFQSKDHRLSLLHNGQIYNYRALWREVGEGEPPQGNDSEVLMRYLEQAYEGDLCAAVKKVLPRLDGVYALAVTDQDQTVLVRDRIGVRQLYYARSKGKVIFASERKPLWDLLDHGEEIHRLEPGHLLKVESSSTDIHQFWDPMTLRDGGRLGTRDLAMRAYDGALRAAVRKRVEGRDRVGIVFSGGIDSVLIAFLVREAAVPFTCYTVGCGERSNDIEWSERVAREFGFPIRTCRLSNSEVEALLPQIIHDIEDHSLNQVEVSIPLYAANRMAQEAGERVLLTGQGADELFGGYSWYPRIAAREGYEPFVDRCWEDTCLLYKECLEREDKIAMAHSIELRVPYLDPEVIRVAFQVPPEWKVKRGEDPLGKHLHRDYAQWIGVPESVACRVKEAAQHGANVHDTIGAIAAKSAPAPDRLELEGYDPDISVREKLGSSSRYGYRYGDEHLWKPSAQVQYYLDGLANEQGVLLAAARDHWRSIRARLETA